MRLTAMLGVLVAATVLSSHCLADEEAVKAMLRQYMEAFNARETQSIPAFWGENAVFTDQQTGERTEGRTSIVNDIEAFFAATPDSLLTANIEEIRLIRPNVASVSGTTTVAVSNTDPVISQFSAILIEEGDKWVIESLDEMSVPAPESSQDALSDLEWLLGHWRDESENARIDNVFRRSEGGNYLIRVFSGEFADGTQQKGTQVIGWDPRSMEIRSWTFNSDGSFGDATWHKIDEEWVIRSRQTLVDGTAASGTFVLSSEDNDRITMQLIGHDVEGEPQPSRGEVTLVRVKDSVVEDMSDVSTATAPNSDVAAAQATEGEGR